MLTCTEPAVALDGKYPIGKAADLLGIHRNTLRRYVDKGLIRTGNFRHGRRQRFLYGREILRFWKARL